MTEPTAYQLTILAALQSKPHLFGGLDEAGFKRFEQRRRKNRVARKSRRANR